MKRKKIPKLNYFKFLGDFETFGNENVFFIYGNDAYQKDKSIQMLRQRFITPGTEDFDTITLYISSCQDAELHEQLESLPFMAKKRFVLLKEFDQLKKNQRTILEKYLKNPLTSTVVVIAAVKIDNRTGIAQAINAQGVMVECKKPYNNSALLNWLTQELRNRNIKMDQNARNMLVNNIELNYQAAENELNKLVLFTHNSGEIKVSDVEKTLGKNRESTIYDLQRALGKKDHKLSQTILQNMIAAEDASSIGVMLVSMLNRYFLIIWKIVAFRRKNYKDHEITQNHLHEVFYSFRDDYMVAASNFSREKLSRIFDNLLQADTELKSINMEENTLFLLIYRICHD